MADAALLPLASNLMNGVPGWAQSQQLQVNAAVAIKALVENVQGENPDVKNARRATLLNTGIVPRLIQASERRESGSGGEASNWLTISHWGPKFVRLSLCFILRTVFL